jgi:hypothetical protein
MAVAGYFYSCYSTTALQLQVLCATLLLDVVDSSWIFADGEVLRVVGGGSSRIDSSLQLRPLFTSALLVELENQGRFTV